MVRSSKGRQKLEMVKIPNDSNLMVTFSKRRSGLFKKASEISTLCGAEVTIIVFSPGKKVFSFGHPSVEKVVERFVSGNLPQSSGAFHLIEAHRNARVCELNMQLTRVLHQTEMEKKRGEELDKLRKASQSQNWWEKPIQELDLEQLEQLKASLLDLKQNLARQAEQVLLQNSAPPQPFITPNPSTGGNLPFDPRNTGFNSNMAVAHFSTNTTMTPFNTNMTGAPFNTNMTGTLFNENMTGTSFNPSTEMAPYGYNLGYRNGFF